MEIIPIEQGKDSLIALRDPEGLTNTVVMSYGAVMLAVWMDGRHNLAEIQAKFKQQTGRQVALADLEQLVKQLDKSYLLANERFEEFRRKAVEEYLKNPVRPALHAGGAYAGQPDKLRKQLAGFFTCKEGPGEINADAGCDGRQLRGLVSPHIDYRRGGPVYARVWKRARELAREAELVVLLGTDHFGADGALTLTRQHYATPFGVLPTSRPVVDALAGALGEETAFADELHHRSEHSIELAAIWLHYVRQEQPCEVVPILCGSFGHFVRGEADPERDPAVDALVNTLRQAVDGRRALVVAAADLSHVGPAFGGRPRDLVGRARLQAADEELIGHMCMGDAQGFFAAIRRDGDRRNVCGLPPIYIALRVLSPVQGERVAYDRCPADENGTSLVSVCGILFH